MLIKSNLSIILMTRNKSKKKKSFMKLFVLFTIIISLSLLNITTLQAEDHSDDNFTGELQVHYIDVGQGDSILIKAIDNDFRRKMLIDAGQKWKGRDEVVPYLEDLDIEIIHKAIATHPHADHIGGFIEVFANFSVKKVIDSGYEHDTLTYDNYITAIKENDIERIQGKAGMTKKLAEGLEFEIIHPTSTVTDDIHYENIVGQIEYKNMGFLFTGDLEVKGERSILARGHNIENQVLKVGHHGSSTSSSKEFLQAVNPEISVIQVGKDNRYGHPHQEIIEKLTEKNIDIYRTDYQGNIIVTTNGENYEISESPYDPERLSEKETEEGETRININTADFEKLQELTGVGPAIAENIIEYRENQGAFEEVSEIKKVSGIGEARFADMEDSIKVQ